MYVCMYVCMYIYIYIERERYITYISNICDVISYTKII